MLLLFTCNVVNRKERKIQQNTFTNKYNLSFTTMSDFKIVNSSFYSDNSDDLDHVYAAEYIEDKTESQQTNHVNSTAHVETKGD